MKVPASKWLGAALVAAILSATLAGPVLAQTAPLAGVAVIGPVGGATVNGSATFMDAGTRTVVTVRIGNAPANAVMAADVHAGICNGPDRGLAFPLSTMTINAQGQATANTTVNVPLATILAEGHYVSIHSGPAATSPSVACGQAAITSGRLPAGGAPAVRLPATGSHLPASGQLLSVVTLGAVAAGSIVAAGVGLLARRHTRR